MRKSAIAIGILGIVLALAMATVPAHAQGATRTWVSGVGDDANPCSRTAPCKTFAGAISKTAPGGIINCIDSAGFGAVTITKSLTIDCLTVHAGVLAAATNGININAGASDIIRLRGLSIEGVGSGLIGVNFIAGGAVHIDECRIFGFRSGSATGINFPVPTGVTSELYVSDTVLADNGSGATNGAIVVKGTGTATVRVTLNRVQLSNNSAGLRVDGTAGTTGLISLLMRDSTSTGNSNAGINVVTNAQFVRTVFDNVAALGNATGVIADGASARVLITRLAASGNNVGISTANGGDITSYLDNHINGNITTNGTPTSTQTPQ